MKYVLAFLLISCGNGARLIDHNYCSNPGMISCSSNRVEVCTSGGWRVVNDCTNIGMTCGSVFFEGREIMACKEL